MPDLAEVFAILQKVDCETLSRVKAEVDRIMREKESQRRQCAQAASRESLIQRCV
jgi:hypothetical protein